MISALRKFQPVWRSVWLVVCSVFWVKRWLVWARQKFPDPPENDSSQFARLSGWILGILLFVAYGFYRAQQVQDVTALVENFLRSMQPIALINTALFVVGLYLLYAFLLRVPLGRLLRQIGYVLYPLFIFSLLLCLYMMLGVWTPLGVNNVQAAQEWQVVLWVLCSFGMICSFAGFAYTFYRATKHRMGAHTLHPSLAPLMELGISTKALAVAAQGQALVLWLPHVPSRLMVMALPAIAVVFYGYQAVGAQRAHMAAGKTSFKIELLRVIRGAGNTRQPFVHRLRSLRKFSRTQTLGFGLCVLSLIVMLVWFPAVLAAIAVLPEK